MSPKTRSPRNSRRSLDTSPPALACVSARSISRLSEKVWPRSSSTALKSRLVDDRRDPLVADRPRPLPDFPPVRAAIGRKEDDLRLAHEIRGWNVPPIATAVVRIVAIVAHHEVMAGRHHIDLSVVRGPVGHPIQHVILFTVRQRLLVAGHVVRNAEFLRLDVICGADLGHGLAVYEELPVAHLNSVTRQADDALDVIGRIVRRKLENDHVTPVRIAPEDQPP